MDPIRHGGLNAKTGFVNFCSVYQSLNIYGSDYTLSEDYTRAVSKYNEVDSSSIYPSCMNEIFIFSDYSVK